MTARRASAEEMTRWGVVNAVVPADILMSEARALADRVAACAPLSLRAIKEIDAATQALGEEAAFARMRAGDLDAYGTLYDSADAAEGMASVMEKRTPVWTGR